MVATSVTSLATGFSAGPAVTDACGDVYVYEGGSTGIVEIQAGTGVVKTIAANTQGYTSSNVALYMDAAKKNLYFPDFSNFYTTHFAQLPIVNCVPGTINATFANNLGNLGNYYWGTLSDAAGDAAGNVYFTTTANVTQAIYKETLTAGSATYADSQILTWRNNISHIAADAVGNVYFTDTATQDLYKLALTGTSYAAPAVFVTGSHFGAVSGLSVDPLGNLYVSDSQKGLIFEVPIESGSLNPADLFATAGIGVPYKVAVDASHNIYLSNYGPGAVRINPGSAAAPPTPVAATSASFAVTYVFNAQVTPTSIKTISGAASPSPFSALASSTGACAVGRPQAALSSCIVNLAYTPNVVGQQTSTLLLGYASGSVTSNLAGVGLGAAATIDPGGVVSTTTTLSGPSGITVDNLGNIFVTDATANTLTEFPAGSNGVGTVVSTGPLKLSGPKAVAVDSSGDIFIADTGNNRIVEVPVINGTLTNASTFALPPTLKGPQGVGVDAAGDLIIADTGDNTLLLIPNINGVLTFSAAQTFGSGLNGPNALTVDANGNLFVAESGSNDVLRFSAPLGGSAQVRVASGFLTPTGVATDASGALFVVESGSGSVFRFPLVNGIFGAKTLVGVTVISPVGVASDASGNLYVTDTANSQVAEITRVAAILQFGGVNVGTTGTATGAVNSSGNLPLVFQTPDYTAQANAAPGFAVTGDTCRGATLAPGASCSLTATYTPTAPQLNAEQDLTFAANGSNGTLVMRLVGTGARITPSTLSLALTSPANSTSLSAGQAVTFTATVGTGSNPAVAGGSVKFFVNGSQVATVSVQNKTAVLTLRNGLPSGNAVTVSATYTGDVINYSGSSAQLVENVLALSDTISLTVVAPYNNPLSANDNAANPAGPSIGLMATIAPSSTIAPGGTVTFYAGTTVLGIASVVPSSTGAYTASLTTTSLRAGTSNAVENGSFLSTYNISAVYSGDPTYSGATSGSLPLSIVGANTKMNPNNTTGATFTLTPANPTITVASSTASGSASGAATLTITSYGGWAGVLNFTCSGLPAYAACAPFPGAAVVSASTPAATVPPTTINFIINTNVPPLIPTASASLWLGGGLGGLLLLTMRRLRKLHQPWTGRAFTLLGTLLLMAASMAGITACSSGSTAYKTPAGTSKVVVTVRAAQLVPGTTTAAVQAQDVNIPPMTVNLVVQ